MDECNNSEFNNFFEQNRILRILIISEKLYTPLEVEKKTYGWCRAFTQVVK